MKWMMSLALLATVAAPALAQDGRPDGGGNHGGGDRGGGQHGGGDRGGGDHGGGRPAPQGQPGGQPGARPQGPQGQAPQQAQQGPRGQFQPRGGYDGRGPDGRGPDGRGPDGRGPGGRMDGPGRMPPGGQPGGVQVHRGDVRQPGGWQGDRRDGGPNGFRPGGNGGNGAGRPDWHDGRGDRGPDGRQGWNGNGGRPGYAGRPGGGGDWNRGWRDDRRYDWRGWRDTHRSYYHVGGYRAPYGFGSGYRRFGVGGRIDAVFFGQQYWISDPWYYRLPPASPPYRWVRYYNDALLIDTYSGMVADEIPDFFY